MKNWLPSFKIVHFSKVLFISGVCISFFASAQNKREAMYMEITAKEEFKDHKFAKAKALFAKLDSLKPGTYNYPLGVCNYYLGQNEKAIQYLTNCLESPAKFPPQLHYFIAKSYQHKNQFERASANFQQFHEYLSKKRKANATSLKNIEHEIQMCKNGIDYLKKPVQTNIINLGKNLNSSFSDYGPVMSADESMIVFTSCRPNTTGGLIQEFDGSYYEDIYIAHKDTLGNWSAPEQMGNNINTDGHDASIAISPDGQKLLFYRYGKENLLSVPSGNLYQTTLKGNLWMQPEKLNSAINSNYWESSGCYSADGKTLYFSSNRAGGFGGSDLYSSSLLPTGNWNTPVNMGANINTAYDEDSPFIHPDGKILYFSSNGMKSMGGHDIFLAKSNSGNWSEPENLGYPINSGSEDTHFSLSADGERLYFSAIRPGGEGDRDIYYAELKHSEMDVMVLKGSVKEATTKMPLEASIALSDAKSKEVYGNFNSNSIKGKYTLIMEEGKDYIIKIEAPGHQTYSEEINLVNVHNFKVMEKDFTLVKNP